MSAVVRLMAQEWYSPAQLGLNGVVLTTERTSSSFSLWGYPQMAVYIKLTWGAATRVDLNLDLTPDGFAGAVISDWYASQSAAIASGAATMSELDIQKSVSASSLWEVRFTELNATHGRLRISSTGGTTDSAIVTAIFGGPN